MLPDALNLHKNDTIEATRIRCAFHCLCQSRSAARFARSTLTHIIILIHGDAIREHQEAIDLHLIDEPKSMHTSLSHYALSFYTRTYYSTSLYVEIKTQVHVYTSSHLHFLEHQPFPLFLHFVFHVTTFLLSHYTHSPLFPNLNSSLPSFDCRPLPTFLFLPPQLPSRCFHTHSIPTQNPPFATNNPNPHFSPRILMPIHQQHNLPKHTSAMQSLLIPTGMSHPMAILPSLPELHNTA